VIEQASIQPVSPQHWLELPGLALMVLIAMEFHKACRRTFNLDFSQALSPW